MAKSSSKHAPAAPQPTARVPQGSQAPAEATAYLTDAAQRTVLFLDTLLDRGNAYREHLDQGTPPLLKFDHELVLDGARLAEPCNYALLRLIPPSGMPVNDDARPLVVVDPRAGHGPGIGGFKHDSEVGVAMRAGHPVYFVTFRPQPEDGQTLFHVMHAEAQFLEAVIARHPRCASKPVVIGNCQAGWAMMALNATRPELFGPLMVVGAPLSYWAGSSKLNPMRYSSAALGGSWLASFTSDLGADRFDGAYLVENFEKLNPANTLWSRYYKLWANVDTEAEHFLEFERWWGGYFRMTGSEIETIVENLFVGNRLARGEVKDGDTTINLRNITAPIVVFASHGDNITPVPQSLDWIIDTWGDERAIAAAGRTIVYVLHESVGHLGIFVGGEIARKEHDQLVTSMDVIESLPPGLYEMKVQAKDGKETQRWDELEPGQYTVNYLHRTMQDILALNPEGREEEALFSTIAKVSEFNATLYKTWMRPWVKMFATREVGDAIGKMHALRMQREVVSDALPFAPLIRDMARQVREQRVHTAPDNPLSQLEKQWDAWLTQTLSQYRDQRDAQSVEMARALYGPHGLGFWIKPDAPDAQAAQTLAQADIAKARAVVMQTIAEGEVPEAVCRIIMAGMVSIGSFERRSLRLARLLAQLPAKERSHIPAQVNWVQMLKAQARITAVAPIEALNALEQMLPNTEQRELALALSAAVMMIEPTLSNPRSEIIEFLIGTLGVDPERVIGLVKVLTDSVEAPPPPKGVANIAAKAASKNPDKSTTKPVPKASGKNATAPVRKTSSKVPPSPARAAAPSKPSKPGVPAKPSAAGKTKRLAR
jgi:pimeloyl-ACP methyl ester carboxylesterase